MRRHEVAKEFASGCDRSGCIKQLYLIGTSAANPLRQLLGHNTRDACRAWSIPL